MKSFISVVILYFLVLFASAVLGQEREKKVVITGVRFAYPLVEKWIKDYSAVNPAAQIEIAQRTTRDPSQYDLLIEAFEQESSVKETREYLYFARYAILPVANAYSAFAKTYGKSGLTTAQLKEVYFHDILAEKKEENKVVVPFTVYTRLQKAGAPGTFAKYFGYQQQSINGKTIAGADEHLIKAIVRDTTGVSYGSISLLYDLQTRTLKNGITVIPVDQDGNGRISENEKKYTNLDDVISIAEEQSIKNIPVEYLHVSIGKVNDNPAATKFLQWVLYNGQDDLHAFGFLKPETKRFENEKEKFEQ